MDLRQLEYFVEVVNSGFNLSVAAKKLYISQPALSQFIKMFEENENIELFERYKGRLQGLTSSGVIFYENALVILNQYNMMLTSIRDGSGQLRGKVRIGIPPLVLGIVFADLMAQLIIKHPDIEFEIIEKGAYELSKMFIRDELDLAILLKPTDINPDIIDEYLLREDELTAFLNRSHPLANKEKLEWSDLTNQLLAILDPTFKIQHDIQTRFDKYNVTPKRSALSSSWDFLMRMVSSSDFITILPSPVQEFYADENIIEKHFENPIQWKVLLCRPKHKKGVYSKVNQYIFDYILNYFSHK